MSHNIAPTSVSGALVGDSRRFLRSWDSFAFSQFFFLVSENSHSLMGGSDVVNCGRCWALWAHRIAVRISNMLLSVWGLFVGEQTNCVDYIAVGNLHFIMHGHARAHCSAS